MRRMARRVNQLARPVMGPPRPFWWNGRVMPSVAAAVPLLAVGVVAAAAIGGTVGASLRRARAQAQLFQRFLTVLAHSVGDGVILIDANACVMTINPLAAAVTGVHERHATGRPLGAVLRLVDPETRSTVVNPALKALYKRVVVGPSVHAMVGADGRDHRIHGIATPICDDRGRPLGCVLVFAVIDRGAAAPVPRTNP